MGDGVLLNKKRSPVARAVQRRRAARERRVAELSGGWSPSAHSRQRWTIRFPLMSVVQPVGGLQTW